MTKFDKILIANRGEIAVRVMRSARALGYRTVAVFSDADADALHVQVADEAVRIGPAPVGESYLKIDNILAAIRASGAQAVHPGYGFLSENADFADALAKAGVTLIGPPADAIRLMGDKRRAKIAMIAAGVPCVPGYEGDDQSDEKLLNEARKVGLPLMIKAAAGGGGRGMRLVNDFADVPSSLAAARAEAKSAFGDGDLILERALMNARHVEIQVFGDKHGNVVHFGERDCSVQRRHQKVIEESPSPAVNPELRAQMGAAAVQAARACNYVGAGTVEFLLDGSGEFYFLEMNTRLQVEHPVTEMVTGVDLVELQLRVAAGEPMGVAQDEISLTGHAMEARLYAEDPRAGFLPQTGKVELWRLPDVDWLRVDHGVCEGQTVSPFYDPMLAKVIAYGRTRTDAARRLAAGLEDIQLAGVRTNQEFLVAILRNQTFLAGEATTRFIETSMQDDPSLAPEAASPELLALAAALRRAGPKLEGRRPAPSQTWIPLTLALGRERIVVRVLERNHHLFDVDVGGEVASLRLVEIGATSVRYELAGVLKRAHFQTNGPRLSLNIGQGARELEDLTLAPPEVDEAESAKELKAPMDGAIVDVRCEVGQKVTKGQTLVVLEAMKMQHQITAGMDAVVSEVDVSLGAQVKNRQRLVLLEPDAA